MEQSLDTALALLESALAKGINYWDTARSYGHYPSKILKAATRRTLACVVGDPVNIDKIDPSGLPAKAKAKIDALLDQIRNK